MVKQKILKDLEKAVQDLVSIRETATQTGFGPDQPAPREGFPVMIVFAIAASLTGLALLVFVLTRKTGG